MQLAQLDVMPVRDREVPRIAQLLAAAFEIDPAYRYLFPDPATRERGLIDFFGRNLRIHVAKKCTHVLAEAGAEPCATVTLRPPDGAPISALTMLRRGLVPFVVRNGRAALERLLWLKNTYDALEKEAARDQPHFYVHMMAVSPEHQGRGAGSELLDRVLTAQTRTAPELPIVLSTHLERNLMFYQRAGFEVVAKRELAPPRSASYTVWLMRSADKRHRSTSARSI